MRLRSVLLAVAAGLALADASIVTLALPELLTELDTTIEGVAAVIGVYTLALCAALLSAWRIAQIAGYRAVGVAGFVLFAVASAACAQADTITVLLAGRAVQAIGGRAAWLPRSPCCTPATGHSGGCGWARPCSAPPSALPSAAP